MRADRDQEKRDRARELYEAGASVRDVADQLDLSVSRTYTLLTEAGAQMRPVGHPGKERDEETAAEEDTTAA